MLNAAGVYCIRNVDSGQRYVGSSTNIRKRLLDHKLNLVRGTHKNPYLQNAWLKHGAERFVLEPLVVCGRDSLLLYEQILIDGLNAHHDQGGYNMLAKAYSTLGRPASELQKETARRRTRGVPNPVLSRVLKDPVRAESSRQKLSELRRDPEVEARRVAAIRAAYADPAKRAAQAAIVKGIKRSPETKEKNRAVAKKAADDRKRLGLSRATGPDGRFLAGDRYEMAPGR